MSFCSGDVFAFNQRENHKKSIGFDGSCDAPGFSVVRLWGRKGSNAAADEALVFAEEIGRRYEWACGTDISNTPGNNLTQRYRDYDTLKDSSISNGTRSAAYYEDLQESHVPIGSGDPDNIADLYYDLRDFITAPPIS